MKKESWPSTNKNLNLLADFPHLEVSSAPDWQSTPGSTLPWNRQMRSSVKNLHKITSTRFETITRYSKEIATMELLDLLCGVYILLTVTKISQLVVTLLGRMSPPKTNSIQYAPSFEPIMLFVDYVLIRQDDSISKLPRKLFREITDPWVKDYTERVRRNTDRKPRVFSNLKDAVSTFYMEFCHESSSFMIQFLSNSSTAYLRQPMGLHSALGVLYFVTFSPLMLLRELYLGGNALTFNCKMAAASTLTEVYVVSCKEGISLEEALAKYDWVSGLFSKKQVHAMIGRAACPLYKRELPFPVKGDVMEFDYDVIDAGVAMLRQRQNTLLGNLKEDLYVSHFVLVGLAIYLSYWEHLQSGLLSFSWVAALAPYAAVFYTVRVIVDWQLGITWHPFFYYRI